MPSPSVFFGTILGSMLIVGVVAFIGLYRANQNYYRDPLGIQETGGVLVVAIVIGVIFGGVLGLVGFAVAMSFR